MRKLTDLCDIQYGYAFDSSYFTEDSSYIQIVRIRDVKRGFSKTHYSSIFPVEYVIHKGDLLVGMDGEFNIAKWQSSDALLNQRVCKLTAKEGMNKEYLRYAMIKALKDLENKTSFVTVKHLTAKELNRLELNVPSVAIQNQRENTLSALEKIMHFRSKQLKSLDDLIKARFIEMFGDLRTNNKNWQVVSFNECASIDTNMIRNFEGYEGYPHIGIDSIEKDTGRIFGYRTISEDGVISGKYLFTPKHIIYSKIRPNLNKVALPDFIGLCSADAYPILVKDTVCTREYFGYTLRSRIFLDYILAFSSRTNLPKVNKSQVEGFKLPLPPIELQNQFADFVKQVDKSRFDIKKSIIELEREVVYD